MARILAVALAGILIGLVSSAATVGFVTTITWANDLFLLTPSARADAGSMALIVPIMTVVVPTLGGLAVGQIIARGVAGKRPVGPADAILAVQIREPMPDGRSGAAGTLAALVALATGASVGQYGPLVYLGAAVGASLRRLESRLRDIRSIAIACGVAAAIATAFNAPIAGLIFAHEVVLRHYALRAFAPVAMAAATGHVFAYLVFGSDPILAVTFEGIAHNYEFLIFAAEGILAALAATIYMGLILAFGRVARRLPVPAHFHPALAGLLLGLVALEVPEILGMSQATVAEITTAGAFGMSDLLILAVAKTLVTALCIGFGFAGGVFSPALLIGGSGGAFFGLALGAFLPFDITGVTPYAVCGMMAVASPVIGAPLSTILIVFELTGSYELTIAVMTSVAFANLMAHRIFGRSFFDVQLRLRGIDLSQGRDRAILARRPVREMASQDYTRMKPEDDVDRMLEICAHERRAEVLLVDDLGRFCGRVRLADVIGAPKSERLETCARDSRSLTFNDRTSLWEAMALLQGFRGEAVPLVDGDGCLIGVVPESAVIHGYIEATHDLRREENAGV